MSVVISKYRIEAATSIDGMTDVPQLIALLAPLFWTIVKIATHSRRFTGRIVGRLFFDFVVFSPAVPSPFK